jgi:hypothetical protein
MGYNVIDLIDKAINISIRKKSIYKHIGQQKSDLPSMEMAITILLRQIDNTIKYYETLKKEVEDEYFEEIDFGIYDRMSCLINEFNGKLYEPEINDVKSFLEFSLVLEKNTYALFVDIQGRFVKKTSDVDTKTYSILSRMITNKANFISSLQKSIK